jgi:hypothetical protein
MSEVKSKLMAFISKRIIRSKIIIMDNIRIEQGNKYNLLGCTLSYYRDLDSKEKI